jgi:hypothetical protein
MSKVTINGHVYEVGPTDVVLVIGTKVLFNFKVVGSYNAPRIKLEGDPLEVHTTGDVDVTGDVHGDVDTSGDVTCGNVGGNIDATGDVAVTGSCGKIDASGDVTVSGNCSGKIDTMGKVIVGSHKKK